LPMDNTERSGGDWGGRPSRLGPVGRTDVMVVGSDQSQEGDLRDQPAASETDHWELSPGHQLVGEGPGDAEQVADLGHRVDEPVVTRECRFGADRMGWRCCC
jgi:hypothetical protein